MRISAEGEIPPPRRREAVPALARALLAGVFLLLHPSSGEAAGGPVRAGSFAVGGSVGYAALQMQDLNSLIDGVNHENGTRFDDLNSAYEFTAELRYAISPRVFLGIEGGKLRGETDDPVEGGTIEVSGTPIAVTVGWTVHDEPGISVRLLGGLGMLVDGTFRQPGVGEVSGSDFLLDVGGEIEWRPVTALGISAQALARQALVERPEGFLVDLDFSGGSFRLGARAYFGGRAP